MSDCSNCIHEEICDWYGECGDCPNCPALKQGWCDGNNVCNMTMFQKGGQARCLKELKFTGVMRN